MPRWSSFLQYIYEGQQDSSQVNAPSLPFSASSALLMHARRKLQPGSQNRPRAVPLPLREPASFPGGEDLGPLLPPSLSSPENCHPISSTSLKSTCYARLYGRLDRRAGGRGACRAAARACGCRREWAAATAAEEFGSRQSVSLYSVRGGGCVGVHSHVYAREKEG